MEYAGYVQGYKPLDWSKKTGEVAQNLRKIEAGREEKREKLDKLYSDNSKLIGDVELGLDPSFDNVILNQTMEAKSMVYDAYKKMRRNELSPRQYKIMMQNMSSGIGEFGNFVKNKNKRFAEAEKLQLEGKLGARSTYINELISEMSTFKDYKPMWSDTGHLAIGKIDQDTGKVIGGSVMPIGALNLEQNIINKKFDVDTRAYEYAKRIGKFQVTKDGRLIGGRKAMEDWDGTKNSIISKMYSGPTDAGDALVDSGDGYYFYSEGDGQEVTDKAVKLVKRRDKQYVAELTDSQEKAARELAAKSLDSQVGFTDKKIKSSVSSAYDKRRAQLVSDKKEDYMRTYMIAEEMMTGTGVDRLKMLKMPGGKSNPILDATYTGDAIRVQYNAGTAANPDIQPIEIQSVDELIKYLKPQIANQDAVELDRVYDIGREEYISQYGSAYKPAKGKITTPDIRSLYDRYELAAKENSVYDAEFQEMQDKYIKILDIDYNNFNTERERAHGLIKDELVTIMEAYGIEVPDNISISQSKSKDEFATIKIGEAIPIEVELDFASPDKSDAKIFGAGLASAVNKYIKHLNKPGNKKATTQTTTQGGMVGF